MSPSRQETGRAVGSTEIGGVDVRDVAGCTCLRLRRSARAATRIFDAHLGPVGVTIGQFGVLAQLYGIGLSSDAVSIKELATRIGMDPTTLNRTLKPLIDAGLVSSFADANDRRARRVSITPLGSQKLAAAMPRWEEAHLQVRTAVGPETILALNGLLELAGNKLKV